MKTTDFLAFWAAAEIHLLARFQMQVCNLHNWQCMFIPSILSKQFQTHTHNFGAESNQKWAQNFPGEFNGSKVLFHFSRRDLFTNEEAR